MREKRVNFVVLISSVVVAACASLSYCSVSATDNPHFVDKYVAIISRVVVPFLLSSQVSTASAATVWIPSEDAIDTEGSVKDEFAEVAHVFARPEVKVVKPRDEDEIVQQAVPWTSLKNEWKIYQKVQGSRRKKPAGGVLGKKKVNKEQSAQNDGDDDGSSEEDDGDEEDEEDEEEDESEGRSTVPMPPLGPEALDNKRKSVESPQRAGPPPSLPSASVARAKIDNLPLAFYGQGNHDDDEKDYLKDEAKNFSKKKRGKKGAKDKDDDVEDDDASASNEAASIEDYADYATDDDDDAEEDEEKGQDENGDKNKSVEQGFEQIPLAIREMILNDLANQNNGTGYHPSLTPKVTGGSPTQEGKAPASAEAENDENSGEDNSSEEDEEEDDVPSPEAVKLADSDPTPPAVNPPTKPKKGDSGEDEEVNDDGHGKGKGKGKGKKSKKGKKGGWGKPQGWGWKPPVIHHAPGWGWKEHDGVLEQLVKGSTWEKVLKYYHWKRDQNVHEGGAYDGHGHDDPHHDKHHHEHPGLEFAGLHGGWEPDHYQHKEGGIKKIVKKAFTGSFWERAFRTYAKYKENQAKNPKKPTYVDLDADGWNFSR